MGFCHLEPEVSRCNKEVAALHSDYHRQVQLCISRQIKAIALVASVTPSSQTPQDF